MILGLMRVVGLTGGIASGKSTVSSELHSNYHLHIIDTDLIAHEVLEPNTSAFKSVVKEFGSGVVGEDGKINRSLLADVIFSDTDKRKKLNSIVHPAIAFSIAWKLLCAFLGGVPLVILDAPLLFETGLNKIADLIVVVSCTREQQVARFIQRTGSTEEHAVARINAQKPMEFKVALADVVIDNSGGREQTKEQVREMVQKWDVGPTGWIPRIKQFLFGKHTAHKKQQ